MSASKVEVGEIYNNGEYIDNNPNFHVEDSPYKAGQIDKIIARNNLKLDTICEVGCGAGEILRQLSLKDRYKSVQFSGYEVSQDAFALTAERASDQIQFFHKDLLKEDTTFDAVLCIDVFEHVEDYMGFIRALQPKGRYKIFHIPLDISVSGLLRGRLMAGRESVGHLHYFTPETAVATVADCGYKIIDTMFTPNFSGQEVRGVPAQIMKLPRHALWAISPKWMSTLIGGASMMVLAE